MAEVKQSGVWSLESGGTKPEDSLRSGLRTISKNVAGKCSELVLFAVLLQTPDSRLRTISKFAVLLQTPDSRLRTISNG